MGLSDTLAKDLTAAMKARDTTRTSVLRMARAALKNREIEKGEALDEREVVKTLQGLVKQREDSAEQFDGGGRPELARKERAEISVLKEYLPEGASVEEVEAAVARAIAETGARSPKDMGKVMKAAMAVLAETGKAVDGQQVNVVARKQLGG